MQTWGGVAGKRVLIRARRVGSGWQPSGGYFVDEQLVTASVAAQDRDAARRLWQVSEAQIRAG
jgi:hypothetical protein